MAQEPNPIASLAHFSNIKAVFNQDYMPGSGLRTLENMLSFPGIKTSLNMLSSSHDPVDDIVPPKEEEDDLGEEGGNVEDDWGIGPNQGLPVLEPYRDPLQNSGKGRGVMRSIAAKVRDYTSSFAARLAWGVGATAVGLALGAFAPKLPKNNDLAQIVAAATAPGVVYAGESAPKSPLRIVPGYVGGAIKKRFIGKDDVMWLIPTVETVQKQMKMPVDQVIGGVPTIDPKKYQEAIKSSLAKDKPFVLIVYADRGKSPTEQDYASRKTAPLWRTNWMNFKDQANYGRINVWNGKGYDQALMDQFALVADPTGGKVHLPIQFVYVPGKDKPFVQPGNMRNVTDVYRFIDRMLKTMASEAFGDEGMYKDRSFKEVPVGDYWAIGTPIGGEQIGDTGYKYPKGTRKLPRWYRGLNGNDTTVISLNTDPDLGHQTWNFIESKGEFAERYKWPSRNPHYQKLLADSGIDPKAFEAFMKAHPCKHVWFYVDEGKMFYKPTDGNHNFVMDLVDDAYFRIKEISQNNPNPLKQTINQ